MNFQSAKLVQEGPQESKRLFPYDDVEVAVERAMICRMEVPRSGPPDGQGLKWRKDLRCNPETSKLYFTASTTYQKCMFQRCRKVLLNKIEGIMDGNRFHLFLTHAEPPTMI